LPHFLVFIVISVAYRLFSEQEGQSLWPCNTNPFSLKMSLYKHCIFHFHFSTVWQSVPASGN